MIINNGPERSAKTQCGRRAICKSTGIIIVRICIHGHAWIHDACDFFSLAPSQTTAHIWGGLHVPFVVTSGVLISSSLFLCQGQNRDRGNFGIYRVCSLMFQHRQDNNQHQQFKHQLFLKNAQTNRISISQCQFSFDW